jgi:saccharopine dehydrogenase (NAD+, L-lysine forming)
MKIGIIKEGKVPADFRVALSPEQCRRIKNQHPEVEILVQSSNIRSFKDEEYVQSGFQVVDDLSGCDIILGIKEVPVDMLIPGMRYMFFSHTFKKQEHNKKLFRALIENKNTLIDYELLKDKSGGRILGFGKYAGVAGAYNALLAYGLKSNRYRLKPPQECADRKEVSEELKKVDLPHNFRIVLTGTGRVATGAIEILDEAGIKHISPYDYLNVRQHESVYTLLSYRDYYKDKSGAAFDADKYKSNPSAFTSNFMPYAAKSDMYITCHFWKNGLPVIFTADDARDPNFAIRMVGDISCDLEGPIASTLRSSTIAEPFYGYDPYLEAEVDFNAPNAIGVMAVDNLPCSLPKDASVDFGNEFIAKVLPHLLNGDTEGILEKATEIKAGELMPDFEYLSDYAGLQRL